MPKPKISLFYSYIWATGVFSEDYLSLRFHTLTAVTAFKLNHKIHYKFYIVIIKFISSYSELLETFLHPQSKQSSNDFCIYSPKFERNFKIER